MFRVHFTVMGNGFSVEKSILMPDPRGVRVVFGVIGEHTEVAITVKDVEWFVEHQEFRVFHRTGYPQKVLEGVGFTDVRS